MADPQDPPGRDHAGAPTRRRRSDMSPRQRRKARRKAERRPGTASPEARQVAPEARQVAPETRPPAETAPPPPGPRDGRSRGPKTSRKVVKRRQRRRRRTVAIALLVVVGVLVAGAVFVVTGLLDRAIDLVTSEDPDEPETVVPAGERQPSLVVVTHDEDAPSAGASRVLVMAKDRQTGEATVLLVPTGTIVDVPGRGSFELGEAHTLGGSSLVAASLENLLGARFDGTVELSVQGWAALLQRLDGFEVDVRSRLVQLEEDGGEVRFEAGRQFLDGPRLAEYLAFTAQGETQLEAQTRVQQVINGLFDRLASEPDALERVFSDDAPMIGTDDPQLVRSLLEELADARESDDLIVLTLPVTALGAEDVYQADAERMEELVEQYLAATRPTGSVGAGRSLQILNGNGAPGIGEDVAVHLRDGGYRILLTGNADSFDHDITRIIVYEDTGEQMAIAQDIQQRLGVGEIVRSEVPQSVVDVTIVVGHDYLD